MILCQAQGVCELAEHRGGQCDTFPGLPVVAAGFLHVVRANLAEDMLLELRKRKAQLGLLSTGKYPNLSDLSGARQRLGGVNRIGEQLHGNRNALLCWRPVGAVLWMKVFAHVARERPSEA